LEHGHKCSTKKMEDEKKWKMQRDEMKKEKI
jgi:hypothetical protein